MLEISSIFSNFIVNYAMYDITRSRKMLLVVDVIVYAVAKRPHSSEFLSEKWTTRSPLFRYLKLWPKYLRLTPRIKKFQKSTISFEKALTLENTLLVFYCSIIFFWLTDVWIYWFPNFPYLVNLLTCWLANFLSYFPFRWPRLRAYGPKYRHRVWNFQNFEL